MKLNDVQIKGLREQLVKERNLLKRAEENVVLIKSRIAGLEAVLQEEPK